MKKICLCMIVKNEAHIIKRCLESVRDFVDYWVIADTGSTDRTKEAIAEAMVGIAGEIHDRPWKNSGHNRSEVVGLARDKAEYCLVIDADEFISFDDGLDKDKLKESLSSDFYDIEFRCGQSISYLKPFLMKNSLHWRYRGALHEFPESESPFRSKAVISGLHESSRHDGARSLDPDKYKKDAEAIKAAIQDESDPFMLTRYAFYLAQAYRDAGLEELSLENYIKRASMGGWVEEVFYSLYSAGQLAANLGKPEEQVLSLFSKAFETASWRTESVHAAVFYLREKGKFGLGYLLAKGALDIPKPDLGCLFVSPSVYDYALLDEYCVCAYHVKKYKECYNGCDKLLKSGLLPGVSVDRVKTNMNFCIGKF